MFEINATNVAGACALALGLSSTGVLAAQAGAEGVFTILHNFSFAEGSCPMGKLARGSDGAWYGTTFLGGNRDSGTIFRLAPDGEVQVVHYFDHHADSVTPTGLVLANDGNLYGTTDGYPLPHGETLVPAIVYRLAPDRSFSVVHTFPREVEASNQLVQGQDGALYGSTIGRRQVAYRLALDGTFTVLQVFNPYTAPADGYNLSGSLTEGAPGVFYGVAGGGIDGDGLLFQVGSDASFAPLHSFDKTDGWYPYTAPILASNGALVGTTYQGGPAGAGNLYSSDLNGVVTTLHDFGTGAEGKQPIAAVVEGKRGALFGTTRFGKGSGLPPGTIWRYQDGTVHVLHQFAPDGSEGTGDYSPLVWTDDGALLGVSCTGGPTNDGTIYRLQPPAAD